VKPLTVAALVDAALHAGPLDAATLRGAADGGGRRVEVGLWLEAGRVARARFRATSCASLIAYAEAACRLAEDQPPGALPAGRLRAAVAGVHPGHLDRADLVSLAFARAHAAGGAPPP
jgi:hypothetical protein